MEDYVTRLLEMNGVDGRLGNGYRRVTASTGQYCRSPSSLAAAEPRAGTASPPASAVYMVNLSAAGGSKPGTDPKPDEGRTHFLPEDAATVMAHFSALVSPEDGGEPVFNNGSHAIGEVSATATFHLHLLLDFNWKAFSEYVRQDASLSEEDKGHCSMNVGYWLHLTIQRVLGVSAEPGSNPCPACIPPCD